MSLLIMEDSISDASSVSSVHSVKSVLAKAECRLDNIGRPTRYDDVKGSPSRPAKKLKASGMSDGGPSSQSDVYTTPNCIQASHRRKLTWSPSMELCRMAMTFMGHISDSGINAMFSLKVVPAILSKEDRIVSILVVGEYKYTYATRGSRYQRLLSVT